MLNTINFKLNDTQRKLVEKYYYLAEEVVNCNFNITHGMIACKYYKEDAYQDARIALCKAAYTYNEDNSSGASFTSYAVIVIKNYIKNMIRSHLKYTNEVSDEILDSEDELTYSYQFEPESFNRLQCQEIMEIIDRRKPVVEKRCPYAYEIFIFRTIYGKKMKEIADMFNVPRRTAYLKFDIAQKDLINQFSLKSA